MNGNYFIIDEELIVNELENQSASFIILFSPFLNIVYMAKPPFYFTILSNFCFYIWFCDMEY